MPTLLGLDLGSSSIKAALLDAEAGHLVAAAQSPEDRELEISAPRPGWAEQPPELWWEHVKRAVGRLRERAGQGMEDLAAIGITYQMHGLVLVDRDHHPLRPAIIWCDSRAVEIGASAFSALGEENCLSRFLNSPGNFTASKLRWVMENEPETYARAYKAMLPGDYLAMKLTGEIRTTVSGLSEDFVAKVRRPEEKAAARLLIETIGVAHTYDFQGKFEHGVICHRRKSGIRAENIPGAFPGLKCRSASPGAPVSPFPAIIAESTERGGVYAVLRSAPAGAGTLQSALHQGTRL